MRISRIVILSVAIGLAACKHPVSIEGRGDVHSSTGTRDCTLEESPCANTIEADYVETYIARPREGFRFLRWEGCGQEKTNRCRFDLPSSLIAQFSGVEGPTLVAVFEPIGHGPVADFTATIGNPDRPGIITFDAGASTDPDDNIESYHWRFPGGVNRKGRRVRYAFERTGVLPVRLTVRDADREKHVAWKNVYVANREDPFFADQWHLQNTQQVEGAVAGADINVVPAWDACGALIGCRGEGVTVAVVDDGVEVNHPDLAENFVSGSFDLINGGNNPSPPRGDADQAHGTAVAGILAAVGGNDRGVMGVAPRVQLVGYRIADDQGRQTLVDEVTAAGIGGEDVSSNSWGAPDGSGFFSPAARPWRDAIEEGITNGRGGKGRVYVWAAGNGAPADWANQDGQAGYRGVLAVAALNSAGTAESYAEPGSNILISAPGGDFCDQGIVTTDVSGNVGFNTTQSASSGRELPDLNYTRCMDGTSASTPMVSGVVALMLQRNNQLSWRDVRAILASTARRTDPTHVDWTENGAGYSINHQYGFGALDAAAAVEAASLWELFPEEKTSFHQMQPLRVVPDNEPQGVRYRFDIASPVTHIETVSVRVVVRHDFRGDLAVALQNLDTGTRSILTQNVTGDLRDTDPGVDLDFTFHTVRHLGEDANARWAVTIEDQFELDFGFWESLDVRFYGHTAQ